MAKQSVSSLVEQFGFSNPADISSSGRFRRGPTVDDYVDQGKTLAEAALMVLYHLFGIDAGDGSCQVELRNALQWFAAMRTKNVESSKVNAEGQRLMINVVDWNVFRIPGFALGQARAASLTGQYTETSLATLARIYYNDAKARTCVVENRAEWTGRPFVAMETSTQAARSGKLDVASPAGLAR